MNKEFTYKLKATRFDENYCPAVNTRITTNFANLARGEHRRNNLRAALRMIDNRFNALAYWDNPEGDRYGVELEIVSVDIDVKGNGETFPAIEILKTVIVDRSTGKHSDGIVGNNFSSYVRDYDFSVVLQEHNAGQTSFSVPPNFGDLHGNIFKHFVNSDSYKSNFTKLPVICLSVSDNKTYRRTENQHPVLGVEYVPNESSLTERYFKKMGLQVRYFMPSHSVAPFAFYFFGDLLNDYTNLELVSTIATMETFQKIYRPEIYNANTVAGRCYRPRLEHKDHSITQVRYDRDERSSLAIEQGRYVDQHFITPHKALLVEWSNQVSL